MCRTSFFHYHYRAFISSVQRGKKFSIECLGQFCVIFHFTASFSCQLRQQLLSLLLPTSLAMFLHQHPLRILLLQSSPSFSSDPLPKLSPGHTSVQVTSLVEMASNPQTVEKFKEGQRSLYLLEWPMRQSKQRTVNQTQAPKQTSHLTYLIVIKAQHPGSEPPSKIPWMPPPTAPDKLITLSLGAKQEASSGQQNLSPK